MNVAFYGGETAGIISLLTLLAKDIDVKYVIGEDEKVSNVAKTFNLNLKDKELLANSKFIDELKRTVDLFICCHGKKILNAYLVNSLKCINLHPCLYKYKGASPIKRLIADGNSKASIASHWMTEEVDAGETIVELFKKIDKVSRKTEAEVYNELYSLYCQVIIRTLEKIKPIKIHKLDLSRQ